MPARGKRDLSGLVGTTAAADAEANGHAPAGGSQAEVAVPAAAVPAVPADAAVPAEPAAATGELPADVYPVALPRDEPMIPLNVKVRWRYRFGLPILAGRNGRNIQDEVDEALRAHFTRQKFNPPDYFRH